MSSEDVCIQRHVGAVHRLSPSPPARSELRRFPTAGDVSLPRMHRRSFRTKSRGMTGCVHLEMSVIAPDRSQGDQAVQMGGEFVGHQGSEGKKGNS